MTSFHFPALKAPALAAIALLSASGLLGCRPPPEPTDPRVPQESVSLAPDQVVSVAAAKPSAPVELEYELQSKPEVGQPLEIALKFHSNSAGAPVFASYRVLDASALSLDEVHTEKLRIDMIENGRAMGRDRLRIIPSREGRHFVNVLLEVETESGVLSRSVSIPVEVNGSTFRKEASQPANPETGGKVDVDAEGEAVMSLPAQEDQSESAEP